MKTLGRKAGLLLKRTVFILSGKFILSYYDQKIIEARKDKELYIDKAMNNIKNKVNVFDSNEYLKGFQELAENDDDDFRTASQYRDKEINLLTYKYWASLWIQIYRLFILIILCAILAYAFPTSANNINIGYYSALSQIFPVMLIALYLTPRKDTGTKKIGKRDKMLVASGLQSRITGVTAIALGTIVSLVVLAKNSSNTFTLLVTVASMSIIAWVVFESLQEASTNIK